MFVTALMDHSERGTNMASKGEEVSRINNLLYYPSAQANVSSALVN